MLAISSFAMRAFGLPGFMVTWIVWEILQTAFVVRLNDKLFPPELRVTVAPLIRLSVFMTIAFALTAVPAFREKNWPLWLVVLASLGVVALLGTAAYFVFQMGEIRDIVEGRIRRRREANASPA